MDCFGNDECEIIEFMAIKVYWFHLYFPYLFWLAHTLIFTINFKSKWNLLRVSWWEDFNIYLYIMTEILFIFINILWVFSEIFNKINNTFTITQILIMCLQRNLQLVIILRICIFNKKVLIIGLDDRFETVNGSIFV